MVVYQAEGCKTNKVSKKTLCDGYKIYGLDEKGQFIKDKGKVFILSIF